MHVMGQFEDYFIRGAFFWKQSGYSHSGLGITEYTEYQFPKERIFWKRNSGGGGDLKTSVSAHAQARVSCKLQFLASWKRSFMDEVFSVTTSILAVYLIFRLASFSKNLLRKTTKNYLCYLLLRVVQGVAESSLAYKGLSKKLLALFWPRKCSFLGGATGKWVCRY